jgi:hypothetical protein
MYWSNPIVAVTTLSPVTIRRTSSVLTWLLPLKSVQARSSPLIG